MTDNFKLGCEVLSDGTLILKAIEDSVFQKTAVNTREHLEAMREADNMKSIRNNPIQKVNRFQEFIVAIAGTGFVLIGSYQAATTTSQIPIQNMVFALFGLLMIFYSQTVLRNPDKGNESTAEGDTE